MIDTIKVLIVIASMHIKQFNCYHLKIFKISQKKAECLKFYLSFVI